MVEALGSIVQEDKVSEESKLKCLALEIGECFGTRLFVNL